MNCLRDDAISFLTPDEVVAIHEQLVDAFGGLGGIRDRGLLESALYRPRTGYYDDLIAMGAALFESLLMNHPFVDGNKRVAFFATDVFSRVNGYQIEVDANAAHQFLIGILERGETSREVLDGWLRGHVLPTVAARSPS